MASVPRLLGRTALTTSYTDIYVVPAGKKALIRQITLSNPTASAKTFYVRNAGVSAEPLISVVVDANSNYDWYGYLHLIAAEALEAYSSDASAATAVWVMGDELTLG